MGKMAERLDTTSGTIYRWMDKHDIESREQYDRSPHFEEKQREKTHMDPDWLREKYHEEGLSLNEMGELAGVNDTAILHAMKKYGIERREAGGNWKPYATYFTNNHGHEVWTGRMVDGNDFIVPIHRLVAVAYEGVETVKDKHVHHKNHIPWDNRPENLEVMSVSDHRSYHAKERGLSEMGAEATRGTTKN